MNTSTLTPETGTLPVISRNEQGTAKTNKLTVPIQNPTATTDTLNSIATKESREAVEGLLSNLNITTANAQATAANTNKHTPEYWAGKMEALNASLSLLRGLVNQARQGQHTFRQAFDDAAFGVITLEVEADNEGDGERSRGMKDGARIVSNWMNGYRHIFPSLTDN